jgi:hypothetical protein
VNPATREMTGPGFAVPNSRVLRFRMQLQGGENTKGVLFFVIKWLVTSVPAGGRSGGNNKREI